MKQSTKIILGVIGLLVVIIVWRMYVASTAEERDLKSFIGEQR